MYRVLVVSHTYISSINRDKWKVLARDHKDITLMIVFPKYWPTCLFTHHAEIGDNEQTEKCRFVALDTVKEGNEILYYYAHRQLYDTIKSFRPDLVHVEQGAGALSYLQTNLYAKWLYPKVKSVFFTWLNWTPQFSLKHHVFLSPLEKLNLAYSHGAIVGNHDAQNLLRDKGFKKPILILPQLGINTTIFKPDPPSSKQALGHTKYICYIGRIIDEKGIFDLGEAFVKLSQNFADWNLLFVGKGPASLRLRSFIATHRMHNRIYLNEPVAHERIASLLNTIDILVLPSYDTATWREQFGHVLIEAMACKVPIIGSDAGEIPHVIESCGLIFKQRNEHALMMQLTALMQDEALRKK